MPLDVTAFGEGSTDYTAYNACMAARAPLREAYDAARATWTDLDNFLRLGGVTASGAPALLPGYGSLQQMQDARAAAEAEWRALYLELQRTEAECNKIAPFVKTAQQLADESEALSAAGGGFVPSDTALVLPPRSPSMGSGSSAPVSSGDDLVTYGSAAPVPSVNTRLTFTPLDSAPVDASEQTPAGAPIAPAPVAAAAGASMAVVIIVLLVIAAAVMVSRERGR